jgi:hypothetical protein
VQQEEELSSTHGNHDISSSWNSFSCPSLTLASWSLMSSLKVHSNHAKTKGIIFSLPLTRWLQQREGSSLSLFPLHRAPT